MQESYPCPACGAPGAPGTHCPSDQTKIPFPILRKGFQAGEYVGLEKIGEGGMGEVWRGEQPQIQKKVAIKILHEKIVQNADLVTRFQREALAVNKIESKHIVDIFSLGRLADGRPYMVMEFLQGESLQAFMEERGPLPYREILSLMEQLCKGLQAAHCAGVVHRDLKPDNVFLVQDKGAHSFVKLLDFGIAKLQEGVDAQQPQLTEANATFGTPAYISPEQLKGASDVDHRADLYSLGVILFEMVTGRTPFFEGNEPPMRVMLRHVSQEVPSPSEMVIGRAVPASLDFFIKRALSKDAEHRPQSCQEFLAALEIAIGEARSPQLDVLEGAVPVWRSDFAKEKQRQKRATPPSPTKQVQHQELSRASATTERESIPAFEVPSSPELSPRGPRVRLAWIGGAALALSLGLLFLLWPARPSLVRHASLAPTPQTTAKAQAPTSVLSAAPTSAELIAPDTMPTSAPALPATVKAPTKKDRPLSAQKSPLKQEAPVVVAAPDEKPVAPKERPRETANPFEHKETANPFGQKP